jgi:hypothetical protein
MEKYLFKLNNYNNLSASKQAHFYLQKSRFYSITNRQKLYGRLAQLVEQLVYTEKVGGSNPSPPTRSISWQATTKFYVPPVGIEPTLTA